MRLKSLLRWFLLWNVVILVFIQASLTLLPLQNNYLGGALGNYTQSPLFWAHANYDGDHYIEIARHSYGPFEYFYFPLYPILLKLPSIIFQDSFAGYTATGIIVSLVSTLIAASYLTKLIKLDTKNKKLIIATLVCLFVFPTSFYFQMVYTEGIFLALTVLSFYFARKDRYLLAALFASLAAVTKVIGIGVIAAIFVEWLLSKRKLKDLLPILLSPISIAAYMFYLWKQTGDPLVFINRVGIFGDQRSSHLIMLPQVFYRYLFKLLPNLPSYWPTAFTILLEFTISVIFLVLLIISFKKMRKSYWLYAFVGYLVPTLAGSFSSMPRYVLVLFPLYIFLAQQALSWKYWIRTIAIVLSIILLGISTALFSRGYWLS